MLAVELVTSDVWLKTCLTGHVVIESLNDATIFTRESTLRLVRSSHTIMDVRALLRDKHRVLAVAEVVLLDKDARTSGGTYAIFGVAVVVVVVDVQVLRLADTWMA